MFKKICSLFVLSSVAISSYLSAQIEYDIQDIGTLQTRSSQAIGLNNQGQILGWYNIDGSNSGKHFFVRDRDGSFCEIPSTDAGIAIDWRYLTDNGVVYGDFKSGSYTTLFRWNGESIVNLGNLPGKEIAAINNTGQVLIKNVAGTKNGKSFVGPVIWENGNIIKLNGLVGDLGIEAEESFGLDMNNNGDVVGQSLVSLSYKNEIYKQVHAVKWINGQQQPINLHNKVSKNEHSSAIKINDLGEILVSAGHNTTYFIRNDNFVFPPFGGTIKALNNKYMSGESCIVDRNNIWINIYHINKLVADDINSIWLTVNKIVAVNEAGEAIVQGRTIYGEEHTVFLVPVKQN